MNDSEPSGNVSIRDIAARAGVNISTVSRALRDAPQISPDRRRQIQELAREMGYVANPLYSALGQARRAKVVHESMVSLAFITDDDDSATVREIMGALHQNVRSYGYSIDIFTTRRKTADQGSLSRTLYNRGVQGVILGHLSVPMQSIELDWSRFAVIELGFSHRLSPLHRVGFDHFAEMIDAMNAVTARGYQRIGLIISPESHIRTRGRRLGAYTVWRGRPPGAFQQPLMWGPATPAEFAEWYAKGKWDAILVAGPSLDDCRNAYLATGIGREIGFASLNPTEKHRLAGAAGMVQRPSHLATVALRMLHGLLVGNERGLTEHAQDTLIRSEWVDGTSLPAKK